MSSSSQSSSSILSSDQSTQCYFSSDSDVSQPMPSVAAKPPPLLSLVPFSGSRGFRSSIASDSRLCHVILPIPDDFVSDEFNQCNIHRFPHWINVPGDIDPSLDFSLVEDRIMFPASDIKHMLTMLFLEDFGGSHAQWRTVWREVQRQCLSFSHLFVLVHQRYALTKNALQHVKQALNFKSSSSSEDDDESSGSTSTSRSKMFVGWKCPRVLCREQQMLPWGKHYEPNRSRLMAFCPACLEVYDVGSKLDGALYGPSWAHFYNLTHPMSLIQHPKLIYEPRIYGFPIAPHSVQ